MVDPEILKRRGGDYDLRRGNQAGNRPIPETPVTLILFFILSRPPGLHFPSQILMDTGSEPPFSLGNGLTGKKAPEHQNRIFLSPRGS